MTTEKLSEYSKKPEFQHCNNCMYFVPFYFNPGPDIPAQKYSAHFSEDTGICKLSMRKYSLTEFWRVSCDEFVFCLHPSFDIQEDELKWYIDFKNRTCFKKSKRYGNNVNG